MSLRSLLSSSSLKSAPDDGSSWNMGLLERCGLGMIGVNAGDGIGVGISRMGERHLLLIVGISSSIVGGCNRFDDEDVDEDDVVVVLCAFRTSSTGTSMVVV